MPKDNCQKCGKYTWVDYHHILPKSVFGEEGETVPLCPTCHRDYHEQLGYKNLKNTDMYFHIYNFAKWLSGLIIIGTIISFTYFNQDLINQYIKILLAIQF